MAGGGLDEELKRRLKLSARHRSEGRPEGRPPQRPLPTPAHSPQLTTARWWTSSSPGQMGARGMLCREGVGERPCSAWPSLTLPCPVQPAPTPSLGPPASLASDPPPGHRHGSIRREGLLGVTHHFLEGPCCTGPNVPQPLSSPEGASPGQTRAAPEARLCRSLQTHQGGPGNLNPSGREREGEVSLSSLPRTSESDPRPWPQEPGGPPDHLSPPHGLLQLHQPLLVLVALHEHAGHLHPREAAALRHGDLVLWGECRCSAVSNCLREWAHPRVVSPWAQATQWGGLGTGQHHPSRKGPLLPGRPRGTLQGHYMVCFPGSCWRPQTPPRLTGGTGPWA